MRGLSLRSLLATQGWISHVAVMAVGAYMVADVANALLRSHVRADPSALARRDEPQAVAFLDTPAGLGTIAAHNLMGVRRETRDPLPLSERLAVGCSIRGQLRGTLTADRPEWSLAIVDGEVHSINSRLADDAVLVAIHRHEILLERGDQLERCSLDDARPATPPMPRIGGLTRTADDIQVGLELFQKLRDAPEVSLELRRRGQRRQMRYVVD